MSRERPLPDRAATLSAARRRPREQATREVGCFFIASAEALGALGPLPDLRCRDLGALALRGRVDTVRAFCVERPEPGASPGA